MFLSETCVRLCVWLVEEDRMDFETKVQNNWNHYERHQIYYRSYSATEIAHFRCLFPTEQHHHHSSVQIHDD